MSASTPFTIRVVSGDGTYTGEVSSIDDLLAMPPGTWAVAPNSSPIAAEKPANEYDDWNGSSSAAYLFNQGNLGLDGGWQAWCGGAADTLRSRLLVGPIGGHASYAGNEVYIFDPVRGFSWDRLTDPSERAGECVDAYDDGTPPARHGYRNYSYDPINDFFYIGPGRYCPLAGGGGPIHWRLPLAEVTNDRIANRDFWQALTLENLVDSGSDGAGVVDTKTGRYHRFSVTTPQDHKYFDPATQSWVGCQRRGNIKSAFTVYNPATESIWDIGDDAFNAYDLSNDGYGAEPACPRSSLPYSGSSAVVNAKGPGIDYNPDFARFFCWVGGTTVYSLSHDRVFTAHSASIDNLIEPPGFPNTSATYLNGRWRYLPAYGVFILITGPRENTYFYKPTLD